MMRASCMCLCVSRTAEINGERFAKYIFRASNALAWKISMGLGSAKVAFSGLGYIAFVCNKFYLG